MDYTDDEIRHSFEEVPPRELYSDDEEVRLIHPRLIDMMRDSDDEEAGVDPDTRHGNAFSPRTSTSIDSDDEETGVDPDARHGNAFHGGRWWRDDHAFSSRTSTSDVWTVVVPRNPYPTNRRGTQTCRQNTDEKGRG